MSLVTNISGYKFIPIMNPIALRPRLRNACLRLGIKGTILVSQEGINMVLAAERESLAVFLEFLRADERFSDMTFKESTSDTQPFNRMLVRLKREIISFDFLLDEKTRGKYVQPQLLKKWLDEKKDVILLDTRNDYEIEVGTFENALTPSMKSFKDFKEVVAHLSDLKEKTIVTFCTGGVRCEKAAPYMEQQGFKDVYQIEGGILRYFEECGGAYWKGECFVFDQRVTLQPSLEQGDWILCYRCRHPLDGEDQKSPLYVKNVSCSHCIERSEEVKNPDPCTLY